MRHFDRRAVQHVHQVLLLRTERGAGFEEGVQCGDDLAVSGFAGQCGIVEELQERAEGIPKRKMTTPITKSAFFRDQLHSSMKKDTTTSKSEMADVIAANATKTKKAMAMSCPAGMRENTSGRVTKKSPGPTCGSTW